MIFQLLDYLDRRYPFLRVSACCNLTCTASIQQQEACKREALRWANALKHQCYGRSLVDRNRPAVSVAKMQ